MKSPAKTFHPQDNHPTDPPKRSPKPIQDCPTFWQQPQAVARGKSSILVTSNYESNTFEHHLVWQTMNPLLGAQRPLPSHDPLVSSARKREMCRDFYFLVCLPLSYATAKWSYINLSDFVCAFDARWLLMQ